MTRVVRICTSDKLVSTYLGIALEVTDRVEHDMNIPWMGLEIPDKSHQELWTSAGFTPSSMKKYKKVLLHLLPISQELGDTLLVPENLAPILTNYPFGTMCRSEEGIDKGVSTVEEFWSRVNEADSWTVICEAVYNLDAIQTWINSGHHLSCQLLSTLQGLTIAITKVMNINLLPIVSAQTVTTIFPSQECWSNMTVGTISSTMHQLLDRVEGGGIALSQPARSIGLLCTK